MDFTRPEVSTSASNITLSALPPAKSWSAFGEAIARTDLINFGGTTAAPSEPGTAATTGFSGTDPASAAASASCLPAVGVSDATVGEGGAACAPALVAFVGATV